MLVEDYQPNALIAGIYLEQFGFAYDLVKSGQEALEKIKATNYSAVLMDIQMQGMDGYRVSDWNEYQVLQPSFQLPEVGH